MAHCLMCDSLVGAGSNDVHYHVMDMDMEITSIIERQLDHEIQNDGEICEQCFAAVLQNLTSNREIPLPQDPHVCIWCRSSLFRRRTHSLPDSAERNMIASIISPRVIPDGALVCYACWVRARYDVRNSQNVPDTQSRPATNTNECVHCRVSLSRRRSHALPDGPERNFIAQTILPQQIPASGRVCWNCWRAAQRQIQRQQDMEQRNAPQQVEEQSRPEANMCVWCRSSLIHRQFHNLGNGPERIEISSRIFPREVPDNARVCMECWRTTVQNINTQQMNEPDFLMPPATMNLNNFKRTTNSSAHCFVPECRNVERLTVPEYIKKRILKSKKIFVTSNTKVCEEHRNLYNWDILDEFEFSNTFGQNDIEEMLLFNFESEENIPVNFDNVDSVEDNIFKYWTGVTKPQFFEILQEIPSLNQSCKHPKTALGLFLLKARTGETHARISSLFQISKASVTRLLHKAREALKTDFVPIHLGLHHISRDELIGRNLVIPEGLFGDTDERKPIVICDGTYIYLQKSSNYLFQKKTYSLHKHRNLAKPFLFVATDGHIIDVQGPYAATESDAEIMKALFQDENGEFRSFFGPNDIFILDRGFRDAIPMLESLNYDIHKPESLEAGETQLSTIKANRTRCVTLCRWVVEVVNGRFKRDFKLFRQEFFNLAAGHLMDDFKICAALINKFHPVIENRPDAQLILNRALQRVNMQNYLADYVIQNNINRRRAQFIHIDAQNPALDTFPQMSMSDLILFALGIYQIKQSRSYYGEHIRQNGSFEVEVSNELEITTVPRQSSSHETLLLRGRIKSRHQASKIYYTYLLLNLEGTNWEDIIEAYYCSCICGKRTVGCCSHVMTIVWYLGWARHQDNIEPPAPFLDGILVREDDDEE